LGEGGEGRSREQRTGRVVQLNFSSFSEGRALTLTWTGREGTNRDSRWLEWPEGVAKLWRKHSEPEVPPKRLDGRIGELVTDTSNASAETTRKMWLRALRLAIAPRIPGPVLGIDESSVGTDETTLPGGELGVFWS
jgi:hypothetical protein